MDNDDAVKLLQDLGLTSYEARAYVAVLGQPDGAPSAVASAARVPRQRVYDILERLLARGFVVRTSGRRVTYRAVPPEAVLARLAKEEDQSRTRKDRAASALRGFLGAIREQAAEEGPPERALEIIKNPLLVLARQNKQWQLARKRVLGTSKAPYIMPMVPMESLDKAAALINRALKRGVQWRTIFEAKDAAELADCAAINYFIARGEKVRYLPALPIKMSVVDGKESMISLEEPATARPTVTVLAITHHGLGNALEVLFEKLWAEAAPYEPRAAKPKKAARKK